MRRNSLCTQYVMYSRVDIQGMGRITRKEVREVYRKELLNISRVGEFMGIWQFHQACEVLKRPLGTIYPQGTSPHIRNDLNRIILPINRKYDNLTLRMSCGHLFTYIQNLMISITLYLF